MSKPKVRSEAYKERHRIRDRERSRKRREQAGGKSRADYIAFVKDQAAKTKAARESALVIQPSVAKRRAMQANTAPGETVDQFRARGGRVDVLPGFQSPPISGPLPARVWPKAGAWA